MCIQFKKALGKSPARINPPSAAKPLKAPQNYLLHEN